MGGIPIGNVDIWLIGSTNRQLLNRNFSGKGTTAFRLEDSDAILKVKG